MIHDKKGIGVWVSAVLYFGVGIVILTLILTMGMPVVNRMKDKNVATQTKDVFHGLDATIREVAKEGPGSQRVSQVEIKEGELGLDADTNVVFWNFETEALLSEPGFNSTEGAIILSTDYTNIENVYKLTYTLDYGCSVDLEVTPAGSLTTVSGNNKLVITNKGTAESDDPGCNGIPMQLLTIREA